MKTLFFNLFRYLFVSIFFVLVGCQKSDKQVLSPIPEATLPQPVDADTIKILAIGNSFSEDALEGHLYQIAKAAGKHIIIGNLSIGGASLELHVNNAKTNANAYSFWKVDDKGKKTTTANTSIAKALATEKWTHISFQQASPLSGIYSTWEKSLPTLYNYVYANINNKNTKFVLHQTWAYAKNATHDGFKNYNKDQNQMYKAIIDAVIKAKTLVNINAVIPVGTAIQNGRTSAIEDNFNRDGTHLSMALGRYLAACTWYEALFGHNVIGNPFKPSGLSDFEIAIAQNAAHLAILKPNEITVMSDFQNSKGGPLTSAVLIDFGNNTAAERWNQITSPLAGSNAFLKDSLGTFTGIKLTITSRFNSINTDGPKTTNTSLDIPATVSQYSFYGNSKSIFNGILTGQSQFEISGLDKNLTYNLTFFAARSNVTDNRETKYSCKGKNEVIVNLNPSNNTNTTVIAKEIAPDINGKITVTLTAGAQNNNSAGFYYLSALRVQSK